jgi:DNA-binding response OmpR family regulator
MAKPRILIVDDDPTVLDALRVAFAGRPWRLEAVTGAAAALSRHREAPFDVLLVDKNLPDVNGVDLVRQLRTSGDRARVIMLTGYGSAESAVDALNLGIDAYLLKPLATADILDAVEAVLARGPASVTGSVADLDVVWEEPEEPPLEAPGSAARRRGFSVIIAGADGHARTQLAALLEGTPREMRHARDLGELLQMLDEEPDLVIVQGALDAAEVVARIRDRAPDVPCLVVAEGARLATVTRLIELHITALLSEPLDSPALRSRLGVIVGRLRAQRRVAAARAR